MSYCKIIIHGNLCADPEMRYTPKGAAICSLNVAVNRKWTSESGEKKEEVTFIPVTAFGKQAETISQYFKKGKPILLDGRVRQENWEDKTSGQKRSKLSVVLESFTFVGGDKQESTDRPRPAPAATQAPAQGELDAGDSVPF